MPDDRPADAMAGTIALLWGERTPPKRGPRPGLTLDTIARAGIDIADADGLAAVTMQRVAGALGVTKMALYRYVPGKDELVALMTEAAIAGPPMLDDDGWRAKLDAWSRRLFQLYTAHPWALESTIGARVPGPNELGWMEAAVAALSGTPLRGNEIFDVAATLVGHVRGIAAQQVAAGGNAERALANGIGPLLRGREDRFPAIISAMASATPDTEDKALDFGMNRILDGIELLIDSRDR